MTGTEGGRRTPRLWLAALVPVVALVAGALPVLDRPAAASLPRSTPPAVTPATEAVAPAGVTVSGPSGVEGLVPVTPARVLETRAGLPGWESGRRAAAPGEVLTVQVAAVLGVPAARIAGVALNVTVTNPTAAGFLTVYPGGVAPVASTVNFVTRQTVPNGVIVGVAGDGTVAIRNGSAGTVDVIVDLTGWIPTNAGFTAVTPTRALETRAGQPGWVTGTALAPGEARVVDAAGALGAVGGVIGGRRITAVTVNLTAVLPTLPGYLTLYPEGSAPPATSSVNFVAGQIVPNSAVVGVGPTGRIVVHNPIGSTHVVLDVTGYLVEGRTFVGLAPQRLVDTRDGLGSGPLGPQQTLRLKLDQLAGLPRGFVGAAALNLTVARSSAAGYLTAYPGSSPVPSASSVNFVANGAPVANTVVVGVDEDGVVAIRNGSSGTVDLVVDLTGWFPQDSLGLVADARQTRRYSLGEDRLGVVACLGSGVDMSPYLTKLGQITSYYEWLSGGRYSPQFVNAGSVPLRAGWTRASASDPCDPAAWPSGLAGGVRIVPNDGSGAYGLAGPGYVCQDVACAQGRSFPANIRDSLFTANSLVSGGTVYFSIAAHEFGHMLDWPHSYSGDVYGSCREYDNPLDVMSREPRGNGPGDLGTGCSVKTDPTVYATPQGTLALNRYAAGWLDPMGVGVHPGGTRSYTLAAIGGYGAGKGTELLVLPTDDGAAFYTLEVRTTSAAWNPGVATYDGQLQAQGITVHRFDQREDVNCYLARVFGVDRCAGIGRRNQKPGGANTYGQVLTTGSTLVPGVSFTVTPGVEAGVYQVTVSGAAAGYAAIADRHVERGLSVDVTPASSPALSPALDPVICLVASGDGPGIATAALAPDDPRRQGPTPAVERTG
jgi:hypothetical protein